MQSQKKQDLLALIDDIREALTEYRTERGSSDDSELTKKKLDLEARAREMIEDIRLEVDASRTVGKYIYEKIQQFGRALESEHKKMMEESGRFASFGLLGKKTKHINKKIQTYRSPALGRIASIIKKIAGLFKKKKQFL